MQDQHDTFELRIPLDCLVNGSTICAMLDYSKSYVSTLISRDSAKFPKPLEIPGVAGIPIWDVREVIAWRDSPERQTRARRTSSTVDAAYVESLRRRP